MKDEETHIPEFAKGDWVGNGRAGLQHSSKKEIRREWRSAVFYGQPAAALAYVLKIPSPSEAHPSCHYLN